MRKRRPPYEGAAKQPLDLFWRGIGGHIKVFSQPNHQVSHSATNNVSSSRLLARTTRRRDHPPGKHRKWQHPLPSSLAKLLFCLRYGGLAQQLVYKILIIET
jgi:hypothetical protein